MVETTADRFLEKRMIKEQQHLRQTSISSGSSSMHAVPAALDGGRTDLFCCWSPAEQTQQLFVTTAGC